MRPLCRNCSVRRLSNGRWRRELVSGAACDGHDHPDARSAYACNRLILSFGGFAVYLDREGQMLVIDDSGPCGTDSRGAATCSSPPF